MTSIMLATDDELYRCLQEVDENIHISGVQAAEMTDLKKLIETEILLRKEGVTYKNCFYRNKENGNCAVIGGFCTANCSGRAFELCQRNRMNYVEACSGNKE